MNLTKAIIVDDEPDAREVLQTLINISSYPIEIVATCANLMEAVASIKRHKPDVVFLDVQMPNYAGYEIVNFFDTIDFEIIFVTAFDQYALKAFEMCALDYIVKPINRDRLNQSLKKVIDNIGAQRSINEYETLIESLGNREFHKIIIPEVGSNRILNLNDIICIQGQGSYSMVFLSSGEELVVSKTLKYFEEVIPQDLTFFRSQKSWIINMMHVSQFKKGMLNIHLTNGIIAKLSQNKLEAFLNEFSQKK
jgi:two-component system LytT family response regulator